jgi:hypothetical protein
MPMSVIPLPDRAESLDLGGDPHDLPGDLYEWILNRYAEEVAQTREPRSAVLAVARMVTDGARFRRWSRWHCDVAGDIAAKLCQSVCDDTLRAVD